MHGGAGDEGDAEGATLFWVARNLAAFVNYSPDSEEAQQITSNENRHAVHEWLDNHDRGSSENDRFRPPGAHPEGRMKTVKNL